jgi:Protein of unknown function (DUF3024)
MLPEDGVQRIQKWIDQKNSEIPVTVRDQVRYEMDVGSHAVVILECRPPWNADGGTEWTRSRVARLHHTRRTDEWFLYCPDSDGGFYLYMPAEPSLDVGDLLTEIDEDPTGIFWG